MTTTKTVTEARVSWEADHEQYWQGHGIATTNYDACATGCNETLREALKDAFEDLSEQGIEWTVDDYKVALTDLKRQIKSPEMLDMDIVAAECPKDTMPIPHDTEYCSVCAGDWHFYVSIDCKVEEK